MRYATKIQAAGRVLYRRCPACGERLVVDWAGADPEGDVLYLMHALDAHADPEALVAAEETLRNFA